LVKTLLVRRLLKVCERTLEKLVRAGQFPQGLKLGKQVMWADEAVENWLSVALASQLSWQPLKTRRSARQS
jgi:prophage regulatory protein